MHYSRYYNQDIDSFKDFMKVEPSVVQTNSGIQQMVYELNNHNIGIEEHPSNNNRIGELYVFQTNDSHSHAQSEWNKYFSAMNNDQSLTFVKGIFDDGIVKENNLSFDELITLLNSRNLNTNRSYGVRYTKNNTYFSLFVIKGKLVFTVDDKNF
ncbi:hypothetical protein GCM10007332_20800 [Epilithonimonas arachidiradicis]|nr:hypothetical protein GCM10007332_20800 [Epilithonimonas arachidiradicis]